MKAESVNPNFKNSKRNRLITVRSKLNQNHNSTRDLFIISLQSLRMGSDSLSLLLQGAQL